ncbi:GNAT family N-acetyltransferase [Neobacillus niacini]|uniref:GNAT family N-acetyltransferase n=1 Tax=Neobacillus niacini TaxID=86668 RepID=UPI0007AB9B3A|nr:GNAT family N-acetyltransferase [Neobacillus niacini]MEC1525295.1 GNAT family N-acetyltransferase [Neobacillus niacini]
MIRKLTKNDHAMVLSFLSEEPSINLFIIGDLEVFGYDSDFQEIWAEFDQQGEIKAVLLKFYQSFIPYAKGEFNVNEFVSIITSYSQPFFMSGKSDIVEKFEAFQELKLGKKQETFFAECKSTEKLEETNMEIKKATLDDIEKILLIRKSIEEFQIRDDAAEMLRSSMETNTARSYYTEEDGQMTACVSTTAENSISAMIVGVCTRKEYRRKGLATAIMQKLFKDVLNEGKVLCLFYDNPEAGRIYKRLGFKDIGMWTMYR